MTTTAIAATATAHDFITERNLPAPGIQISGANPGAKNWNPETRDWDLPDLPTVTVGGFLYGIEFLDWIAAVGITSLRIKRRELDVTVNAGARFRGITWQIWGSLTRPESWARLNVRPGWGADGAGRNEAYVSAGDFARLVAELPTR